MATQMYHKSMLNVQLDMSYFVSLGKWGQLHICFSRNSGLAAVRCWLLSCQRWWEIVLPINIHGYVLLDALPAAVACHNYDNVVMHMLW